MNLLKMSEEYRANSENEALDYIAAEKKKALDNGYILGNVGYTYKNKKAKGDIIDEAWVVKITKIFNGVWD